MMKGEHIVRKVVPVKDLHKILQGQSFLQYRAPTDSRLLQEGLCDRCLGSFSRAGMGISEEV